MANNIPPELKQFYKSSSSLSTDTSNNICPCSKKSNIKSKQKPITDGFSSILPIITLLGWSSDENLIEQLRKCASLSIATFDIECITVKIEEKNNNGSQHNIEYDFKFDDSNIYQASQHLGLIGYADNLSTDNLINNNFTKIFHLGNNETENENITESYIESRKELVKSFLSFVKQRSLLAKEIKEEILKDIFNHLKNIENEHIKLTNQPFKKRNSEYAKLKRALEALCNDFFIFGFNSAKYDVPILCQSLNYLVLETDENEYFLPNKLNNIKIFKKGESINTLKLNYNNVNIMFKDFYALESPFTSLQHKDII